MDNISGGNHPEIGAWGLFNGCWVKLNYHDDSDTTRSTPASGIVPGLVAGPGPAADSTAVVLYTTEWCPYCRSLRLYLDAYRIPYKEHDVEKSLSGFMGFWALRGRGVPVSVIGPDVVYGYDMARINRSLAALGYQVEALDE